MAFSLAVTARADARAAHSNAARQRDRCTGGDEPSQPLGIMADLGMKPADAIRSATVMTAELFGVSEELGTLEVGKRADIIAVKADPLDDIRALEDVDFVMKSGAVVKQDGVYTGGVEVRSVGSPVKF